MSIANVRRRVTAAEFLVHPAASGASELVRGEVRVMTPASGLHAVIAGAVFRAIDAFVEARELGVCFADNTGFLLPGLGDTVRSPDAAFVAAKRLPREGFGPGWIALAPDLVVEIVSPSESASELEAKVRDYAAAGTRLFWVIDPATRTVCVRSASEPDRWLRETDTLDGGEVLPGFAMPVARLFARVAK